MGPALLNRRDGLRAPVIATRDALASLGPDRYRNGLEGNAYGVELLIERRQTNRLSGWIGYSYGKSRQTDVLRNESFWSDFDQRHALNVSALYGFTDRTSIAATFRRPDSGPILRI